MTLTCIGILGLGSIGRRHTRNAQELGYRVVGFDPSNEACSRFSEDLSAECVDRTHLFDESQAIIIASPNGCHLTDLAAAIEARKPALVEKPFGHDVTLARKLIACARNRHLVIAAAQNLRFRAVVRRSRELLESGIIGRPIGARFVCGSWLPDWRPEHDYRLGYAADAETGGVIFDVVHEFDLAHHLIGPARVLSAVATRTGLLELDSEDFADIVMRHDNGCQTSIHLDYVSRPRQRSLQVTGVAGTLSANLITGDLQVKDVDDAIAVAETHELCANSEYVAELGDFVGAVETDGCPTCPADEAVDVLELVCEARRKAGLPQAVSKTEQTELGGH